MSPVLLPRRRFLQTTAAALAAGLSRRLSAADAATGLKGSIHHSACKWCYPKIRLDDLCPAGKEMGLTSIDLVDPPDFPTLKKYGLTCAMVSYPTIEGPDGEKVGGIPRGFNNRIPRPAGAGLRAAHQGQRGCGAKHVICFSGNRNGMDEETGLKNCADGLETTPAVRRKARHHAGDGTAQQPGESHGLHVRPQRVGRRAVQAHRLARISSCSTTSTTCRSWRAT